MIVNEQDVCVCVCVACSLALAKSIAICLYLMQVYSCYQRGSPCQDPACNQTTQRPPDLRKEMQTAMVWSSLPFIRSGQNHLARHSDRGKKTRPTEEEVGRQHQGMDRP